MRGDALLDGAGDQLNAWRSATEGFEVNTGDVSIIGLDAGAGEDVESPLYVAEFVWLEGVVGEVLPWWAW